MDKGGPPAFWHNLHWASTPTRGGGRQPEAYVAAAAALTSIVGTAGVDAPGGCSTSAAASAAPSTTSGPGAQAAGWRGSTSTERQLRWARRLAGRTGQRRRSVAPTGACRAQGSRTTCWPWSACSTSPAARRSSGGGPGHQRRAGPWRSPTSCRWRPGHARPWPGGRAGGRGLVRALVHPADLGRLRAAEARDRVRPAGRRGRHPPNAADLPGPAPAVRGGGADEGGHHRPGGGAGHRGRLGVPRPGLPQAG